MRDVCVTECPEGFFPDYRTQTQCERTVHGLIFDPETGSYFDPETGKYTPGQDEYGMLNSLASCDSIN